MTAQGITEIYDNLIAQYAVALKERSEADDALEAARQRSTAAEEALHDCEHRLRRHTRAAAAALLEPQG